MEKRMYFLVPYNISEIQKGIQAGHAQMEYALKYWKNKDFQDWAKNNKTWIVLNGGNTNSKDIGDMQHHLDNLIGNNIKFSTFCEPDLNNALSAITFLCDERVYNFEKYPNLKGFIYKKQEESPSLSFNQKIIQSIIIGSIKEDFPEEYKEWLNLIGGKANEFLKDFILRFDLA